MIRQILGEVSVPVANTEVQQVIENPGIVKTYLEKYMPSLISFLVQLVVAIVILLIGIKVIKSIVKIIKKGFDKSRMDAAVASFLANVIKYFLYFILVIYNQKPARLTILSTAALSPSGFLPPAVAK